MERGFALSPINLKTTTIGVYIQKILKKGMEKMANIISEFGTLTSTGSGTDGANCVITNITPIPGGNRVTFQWTDPDGTTRTETMDVMDGTAGKSIQSVQINSEGHLIVYYDDGTSEDAGYVGGGGGSNEVWLPSVSQTGDLSWTKSSSSTTPATVNIMGDDGLGVKSVDINSSNHLIVTYDDDTTHDAGEIEGAGAAIIDDTEPSLTTVYSSAKVESDGFKYETDINTRKLVVTKDMMLTDIVSTDPVYLYANENVAYIPDIPETTNRGITYKVQGGLIYASGVMSGSSFAINVPMRIPYNWANQYVYTTFEIVSGYLNSSNIRLLLPCTHISSQGTEAQMSISSGSSTAGSMKAVNVLDDCRIQFSSNLSCTDLVLRPYFALRNQANRGSGATGKPTAGRTTVVGSLSNAAGILMTMSGANFTAHVANRYPMNQLFGKKLVLCGDSIAEGHGGDSFGYTIAENQNMAFDKPALGTARIASSSPVTSIAAQVSSLTHDYDYILVEGGINDALNGATLGTLTDNFDSTLDESTTMGALEKICKTLIENYPAAKKLFVFSHKCANRSYIPYTIQDTFFDAMKTALKKWNIPYIDLREYPLCAYNATYAATYFDTDFSTVGGLHPNNAGYDLGYIPQITNAMLSGLSESSGMSSSGGGGAVIDDTTPAANKVFSSQKTQNIADSKFDASYAEISGGSENFVDLPNCHYNWRPNMTAGASYDDPGTTMNNYFTTNLWPYLSGAKIKFSIAEYPSTYFRYLLYDADRNFIMAASSGVTLDDDGNHYLQVSKSNVAYMCFHMASTPNIFETLNVGRYDTFGTKKVVFDDLYLNDKNVEMARERLGFNSPDILNGKKWAVAGDSFTHGYGISEMIESGPYIGQYATYPYLIGTRRGMVIDKFFESGRTLALPADGTFTNSFANVYQNVSADTDYLTIYLGLNDSHRADSESGQIPIGTISDNTVATFYGAWNVILSWLIENRPALHIGIIVSNGCESDNYRTATIAIANKYGIPYIDLNGDERTPCMIRSTNANIASAVRNQRTLNWRVSADNTHPNAACHAYEATFIEEFLKTL